jgi:predicted nucleotidyltransferase
MVTVRELLPFVHQLVEKVVSETRATLVVLFGSFARGEAGPTSDIDIMIECSSRDRGRIQSIVDEVNELILREGYKNVIKPLLLGRADADILSHGTVLWGRAVITPSGLRRKILVTYDMSRLERSEKVKLCMALYGHRTKKKYGKKVYVSRREGIVSALGAARVEGILTEVEKLDELKAVFEGFKVPYEFMEIYQKSSQAKSTPGSRSR